MIYSRSPVTNERAVAKFDAGDKTADPRANLNLFDGLEPAGEFIPVRDGALDRLGDRYLRRRHRLLGRLPIATEQRDAPAEPPAA